MEKSIQYLKKSIFYKIEGEGDTLVLLHGFMEDMNMWQHHIDKLSENYQVLAIDLPGHGKSELLSNSHSMDLMADIVKYILDFEKISRTVVIGHSMGGYATLAFAEKYPDSLIGFGLFHSHTLADKDEAKKNRDRMVKVVENDKMAFINQFIPSLYAEENRVRLKNEIEYQIDMANKMNPQGITAALLGMKDRPMRLDIVALSEVPVLFILGKQDSRIPLEKALAQAATADVAQINVFGNAGHMAWQEESEKTVAAVDGFMKLCSVV
ncbi:MAG: alpha/beta hydrolase [Bacteroidales bacterium]|nr:alpha/beta hydrolase [Bacteroidales bacterium]